MKNKIILLTLVSLAMGSATIARADFCKALCFTRVISKGHGYSVTIADCEGNHEKIFRNIDVSDYISVWNTETATVSIAKQLEEAGVCKYIAGWVR